MNIREAILEDLPRIIELLSSDMLGKGREHYQIPLPKCYIDAYHQICKDPNSKIFVVCDDDSDDLVIGCFQITFIRYLSHKGGLRAIIENVRIDQTKHGNRNKDDLLCYLTRGKRGSMYRTTDN